MPTPYEYARLANAAYAPSTSVLPVGWHAYVNSDEIGAVVQFGYFGIAFINSNVIPKQLVIAHRGTQSEQWLDIINDILIGLGVSPAQYDSALQFTQQVKTGLGSSFSQYQVSHTGHSLGAVLAEMVAVVNNVPATTFDSPGSVQALQSKSISFGTPSAYPIVSYNAAPHAINTVNQHIGRIIRVYPPILLNYPITDYISYSLQQHSMTNIVAEFNPSTGQPKVFSVPSVWPFGIAGAGSGAANYINYANNPFFWESMIQRIWMLSLVDGGTTSFNTYRRNYINLYLTGGQTPARGVDILSDDTSNTIWGATTGPDTIHTGAGAETIYSYGGNDILRGGEGRDTYVFEGEGFGQDVIDDPDFDGMLNVGGRVITGTAVETANQNGVYALKGDDLPRYIFTSVGNDLVLSLYGDPKSSINLKNYFVTNSEGSIPRFGITLQKALVTPVDYGVTQALIGVNSFANNGYAVAWVTNPTAQQLHDNSQNAYANLRISFGMVNLGVYDATNVVYTFSREPTITVYRTHISPSECYQVLAYHVVHIVNTFIANAMTRIRMMGGIVCSDGSYTRTFPVCAMFNSAGEYTCRDGIADEPIVTPISSESSGYLISWNCYSFPDRIFQYRQSCSTDSNIYSTYDYVTPNPNYRGPAASAFGTGYVQSLLTGTYKDGSDGSAPGIYLRQTSNVFIPPPGVSAMSGSTAGDVILAQGNTIITSNGGRDRFVVSPENNAHQTITDFDPSQQKLDFSAYRLMTGMSDFTITAGSAIVNLPNNQTIHINNINGTLTPEDLSVNNFIFALPNHAPVANCTAFSNALMVGSPMVVNFTYCTIDPDGDFLTWSLDKNRTANWMQQDPSSGLITGIMPDASLYFGVTYAADPYGLTAFISFNITGILAPTSDPTQDPTSSPTRRPSNAPSNMPTAALLPTPETTPVATPGRTPALTQTGEPTTMTHPPAQPSPLPTSAAPAPTPAQSPTMESPTEASTFAPTGTPTAAPPANHPPRVAHEIPAQSVEVGSTFQLNVLDIFNDQDGDALALAAFKDSGQALPAWLQLSTDKTALGGVPQVAENFNVSLSATDPHNASASTSFPMVVRNKASSDSTGFFSSLSGTNIAAGVGAAVLAGVAGFFACRRCRRSAAPVVEGHPLANSSSGPEGSKIELINTLRV